MCSLLQRVLAVKLTAGGDLETEWANVLGDVSQVGGGAVGVVLLVHILAALSPCVMYQLHVNISCEVSMMFVGVRWVCSSQLITSISQPKPCTRVAVSLNFIIGIHMHAALHTIKGRVASQWHSVFCTMELFIVDFT